MSPRSGWRFSVYVNHPLLWRGHILICSQECCRNPFETILCCWRHYGSCFSSMICCEMGKETDRNLLIHTSSPVKNVQIHVSTLLKDCIKKKTLLSNVLLWTNNLKTKAILGLELFHIRRRRRNQSKACRPWNLYGFNPNPSVRKRWKVCNIEKCKLQNLKLSAAPVSWQHPVKCQSRDKTWYWAVLRLSVLARFWWYDAILWPHCIGL